MIESDRNDQCKLKEVKICLRHERITRKFIMRINNLTQKKINALMRILREKHKIYRENLALLKLNDDKIKLLQLKINFKRKLNLITRIVLEQLNKLIFIMKLKRYNEAKIHGHKKILCTFQRIFY